MPAMNYFLIVFIRVLFTVIWESSKIISIYETILMILKSEKMLNKNNRTEFGKDADLRIPLNWTMIRDNDVSERRFEERASIRDWMSIWVYHDIY
jgi:hypothetical protein